MIINSKELEPGKYEVTFDVQPLADKLGLPKQKVAEVLADEIMKILGII